KGREAADEPELRDCPTDHERARGGDATAVEEGARRAGPDPEGPVHRREDLPGGGDRGDAPLQVLAAPGLPRGPKRGEPLREDDYGLDPGGEGAEGARADPGRGRDGSTLSGDRFEG